MRISKPALIAVGLACLGAFVSAQNLAEAAAKEKERRSKVKSPSKSYNDSTVATFPAADDASAAAGTTPAAGKPADEKAAAAPEDPRAKALADWRTRIRTAREDVTRHSTEVERLQTLLNDTGSLFGAARQQAIDRQNEAKVALGASREKIEGLETEGRRNGYRE